MFIAKSLLLLMEHPLSQRCPSPTIGRCKLSSKPFKQFNQTKYNIYVVVLLVETRTGHLSVLLGAFFLE